MAGTRQIPDVSKSPRRVLERRSSSYAIPWQAWSLAILSGVLQVLAFPIPNLNWLCWIALAPLLVAILHARRMGRVPSSVAFRSTGADTRVCQWCDRLSRVVLLDLSRHEFLWRIERSRRCRDSCSLLLLSGAGPCRIRRIIRVGRRPAETSGRGLLFSRRFFG